MLTHLDGFKLSYSFSIALEDASDSEDAAAPSQDEDGDIQPGRNFTRTVVPGEEQPFILSIELGGTGGKVCCKGTEAR